MPTPCHKCPKVPEAVRNSGATVREMRGAACDLAERDRTALDFYRRCRAVGRFPEDPIVEWYSAIFRTAEDEAASLPLARLADRIDKLLEKMGK